MEWENVTRSGVGVGRWESGGRGERQMGGQSLGETTTRNCPGPWGRPCGSETGVCCARETKGVHDLAKRTTTTFKGLGDCGVGWVPKGLAL